jgi:hypothetical protein
MGIAKANGGHNEVHSLSFEYGHLYLWNAVIMVPCSRELEAIWGRTDKQPQDAPAKRAQWVGDRAASPVTVTA